MPIVVCLKCRKDFYVKPSHLALGWGKYCSIGCRTKGQFRGKMIPCFICKKEAYKSPQALKRSKSGRYFCSKICQTVWRNSIVFVGENHANWRDGESAYRRMLAASDTEQKCILCRTKDKRVLIVHHFDKNRRNNKVINLVWLCNNCYYLVHHYNDEYKKLRKLVIN